MAYGHLADYLCITPIVCTTHMSLFDKVCHGHIIFPSHMRTWEKLILCCLQVEVVNVSIFFGTLEHMLQ